MVCCVLGLILLFALVKGCWFFFVAPFLFFFGGEHAFPTQFVAESFEGEERWMSRK